jgi:hypothetical protein
MSDMFIYCNTEDSPKTVGKLLCKANCDNENYSWKVKDEGEFYTINDSSKIDCVAVIYSVSSLIVGIEIDDNCASKVVELLMEKYSFENVKWLVSN